MEDYDYSVKNLLSVRGLSINSTYLYESDDLFSDYVPEKFASIVNEQNAPHITMAHELGHYLGLYHTFSENGLFCQDTDFCEDTESYDINKYSNQILLLYNDLLQNPANAADVEWNNIFHRIDCSKQDFVLHNLMDYAYSWLDEFTLAQRERVRHVLTYSPFIPGPKVRTATQARSIQGPVRLPLTVADDEPRNFIRKK